MINLSFAALPLALFAATPALAQVMTAAEYVKMAAASDLFERQSSQVVLETTTNADVRSFAMMMQSDHGKSSADVKAAAMKSKVVVIPPKLTALQMEMIAELKAETGTARDAVYIAQQKAAHNKTLSLQQAYASGGTAPALKRVAAKIVPVVQMHIAMLKKM